MTDMRTAYKEAGKLLEDNHFLIISHGLEESTAWVNLITGVIGETNKAVGKGFKITDKKNILDVAMIKKDDRIAEIIGIPLEDWHNKTIAMMITNRDKDINYVYMGEEQPTDRFIYDMVDYKFELIEDHDMMFG